jgi:hypothetical protein
VPCAWQIHVPSLDNPSTQKALNGLKRSVGDAQHPSGLISFFDLLGFAWAQCYYVHMVFSSHKKNGNKFHKKKKSYPTTLFPIKQKKNLTYVSSTMTNYYAKAKAK